MSTSEAKTETAGMTAKEAKRIEKGIIWFCILSMAAIFQPFSHALFPLGCIGVVIGGLAFNLVPFCQAGNSYRKLAKVALIVLTVFAIAVILALLSAWGYGVYLKAQ